MLRSHRVPSLPILLLATASLLLSAAAPAAGNGDGGIPVGEWLVRGPVAAPLPAFHDEAKGGFDLDDLLAQPSLDPAAVDPVADRDGWRGWTTDTVELRGDGPAEAYLATRIRASRHVTGRLRVTSSQRVKAYLDGGPVKLEAEEEARAGEISLSPGHHLLLLHTVRAADDEEPWRVTAALVLPDSVPATVLDVTTRPARAVDIRDILDAPKVSSLAVSPDGKFVALTLGAYRPDGTRERWLEVRETKHGRLVHQWRGLLDAGNVAWAPDGHRLSYTSTDEAKEGKEQRTDLWVLDLDDGATRAVVTGVEHFGDYRWNPDGRSLVYTFTVEAKADERKVKRWRALEDRWPWWRNRSYLMEVSLVDGSRRRLTAGDVSAEDWSFSPDGRFLLFAREYPDPAQRPYSRREWWELDLSDLSTRRIDLDEHWIDHAAYGPDRDTLVLLGSPSAFDGLGRDLPEDIVPNDYGGQVYLFARRDGRATALSRDFDPAVQGLRWHRGRIVARVLDTQYQRLAIGTREGRWRELTGGCEVVDLWDVADRADIAVVAGTSAKAPQQVWAVDLKSGKARLLLDPGADRYAHVTFGRVESFVAELPDGQKLDGRVYYPRDYQQGRRYPVIVYYYGGTFPITRDMGGRYPKNVWAGQGYFVYVPEPSGALGYGQQYAARHVNDWGKRTAWEIIEGTKAFLQQYPDADGERMGCIGASFGGFLTEYLVTQTDMFACAISHAGISNIASYWGMGYWGYGYGARALANAFPWSDRDLYVGQSPLYNADRIHTPLLLLHGSVDTNVPPGESDALYTALKLLGREVEYVRIQGQDHHILDHDQRIVWNDTILAWFARWLKGDPGWWDALYRDRG